MLLSNFPVDIFRHLFLYLTGTEFLTLLASSKPLHHIVLHRGLTSSWNYTPPVRQWAARVLYNLPDLAKLSLSITRPRLPDPRSLGLSHVLEFGSRLQVLKLHGQGAISLLLISRTPDNADSFRALKRGYHGSSHYDWVNLGKLLPQLVTLSVIDQRELVAHLELPETLPRSLTALTFEGYIYSPFRLTFPSLGKMTNLTQCRLNPCHPSFDGQLVAQLHQLTRLTSLEIRSLDLSNQIPGDFKFAPDFNVLEEPKSLTDVLPKGITSLSVLSIHSNLGNRLEDCLELSLHSYSHSHLSHFPPRLTSITTAVNQTVPFLKSLPQTVTNIKITSGGEFYVPAWKLAYMPDSVLHFTASFMMEAALDEDLLVKLQEIKENEGIQRWLPAGIQTLSVYPLGGMDSKHWHLFPQSIVNARLWLCGEDEGQSSETLNLRRILPRFAGELVLVPHVYDTASNLPVITGAGTLIDWTFPYGVEHLRFEWADSEKSIGACQSILNLPADRWPSALKQLHFRFPRFPAVLPAFDNLPPSIEKLSMTDSSSSGNVGPYEYEKSVMDSAANIFAESLANLPRQLTVLVLHTRLCFRDAVKFLKNLPATLRDLECKNIHNFDDNAVAHLPPKLERLRINHAQRLSDQGIAKMPSTITELDLRYNRAITPEALRVITPTVLTLTLPKNVNFRKKTQVQVLETLRSRNMALSLITRFLVIK